MPYFACHPEKETGTSVPRLPRLSTSRNVPCPTTSSLWRGVRVHWGVHGRVWMCLLEFGRRAQTQPVSYFSISLEMSKKGRKACWSCSCQQGKEGTGHSTEAGNGKTQLQGLAIPMAQVGQLPKGCLHSSSGSGCSTWRGSWGRR